MSSGQERQRGEGTRATVARRWSARAARAGLVGASALVWWACVDPEPVTAEQVCDDVRRAIAFRTQACTTDPELANKRYEAAEVALVCSGKSLAYDCSAATLARSCEEVAALGDDLEKWISVQACTDMFGPVLPPDGSTPTRDACNPTDSGCHCSLIDDPRFVQTGTCEATQATLGSASVCCSTGEYPQRGSCTCSSIYCAVSGQEGNRACSCSTKPLPDGTAAPGCGPVTFPDIDGVCCLPLGGQSCFCSRSKSCPSEHTVVSACEPSMFCSFNVGPEQREVNKCSL